MGSTQYSAKQWELVGYQQYSMKQWESVTTTSVNNVTCDEEGSSLLIAKTLDLIVEYVQLEAYI